MPDTKQSLFPMCVLAPAFLNGCFADDPAQALSQQEASSHPCKAAVAQVDRPLDAGSDVRFCSQI